MFSSGPNYTKLKTHLRLAINRLKLLEKKKTELAQKARREIADFIAAGKTERAKIRVEHIIREDYMVEAMELLEMYCDLLLARFGLIQQMKSVLYAIIGNFSDFVLFNSMMHIKFINIFCCIFIICYFCVCFACHLLPTEKMCCCYMINQLRLELTLCITV